MCVSLLRKHMYGRSMEVYGRLGRENCASKSVPQKSVSKILIFTCLASAIWGTFFANFAKRGAKSTCKAGKNRHFLKSVDPPYSQSFQPLFVATPLPHWNLCLKSKICGAELLHRISTRKANEALFKVLLLTRASPQKSFAPLFIREMLQAISHFTKCYQPCSC